MQRLIPRVSDDPVANGRFRLNGYNPGGGEAGHVHLADSRRCLMSILGTAAVRPSIQALTAIAACMLVPRQKIMKMNAAAGPATAHADLVATRQRRQQEPRVLERNARR